MTRPALLALFLVFSADGALAALDLGISRGGSDCRHVSEQIERNWITLKDMMAPGLQDLRRPRARNFHCVDPRYTRDLFERGARGTFGLRCFTDSAGESAAICCDQTL
ncbi:MAG: hypothetical protein HUJ31_00055, partial [Pseudomonadales bacterium]|nr:hypothetical protein [Pseudomonadales bacterium]